MYVILIYKATAVLDVLVPDIMYALQVLQLGWKSPRSTLIVFDNAKAIDKGNYRVRKTLESWHTEMNNKPDNNSKPLPRQYTILSSWSFFII